MLALIRSVCKWLSIAGSWLEKHSATVTTIATVVLAILTFSYLQITKKAVWVQISPKVFIKKIESTVKPDYDKNKLVVQSIVTFTNCGNTEAKNLEWSYTIEMDGQELVKKDTRSYLYLYPEQIVGFPLIPFRIKISPEEMELVKQSQETGKALIIKPWVIKPIILNIEFGYDDQDGKRIQSHTERYTYLLAENRWVIPIQND